MTLGHYDHFESLWATNFPRRTITHLKINIFLLFKIRSPLSTLSLQYSYLLLWMKPFFKLWFCLLKMVVLLFLSESSKNSIREICPPISCHSTYGVTLESDKIFNDVTKAKLRAKRKTKIQSCWTAGLQKHKFTTTTKLPRWIVCAPFLHVRRAKNDPRITRENSVD